MADKRKTFTLRLYGDLIEPDNTRVRRVAVYTFYEDGSYDIQLEPVETQDEQDDTERADQ